MIVTNLVVPSEEKEKSLRPNSLRLK